MAQEYTVREVKTTGQQDDNNNDMLWVTFEGIQDNALMFARKHPEVQGKEYGEIVKQKSKAGKEYYRFYRKQREEGHQAQQNSFKGSEKKEWQPRDDDRIVAQWAIGQAVAAYTKTGHPVDFKEIEEWATKFYAMVDRVKGSESKSEPSKGSGYETFKAAGGTIKSEALANEQPPASVYDDVIDSGEQIDISQIPF